MSLGLFFGTQINILQDQLVEKDKRLQAIEKILAPQLADQELNILVDSVIKGNPRKDKLK